MEDNPFRCGSGRLCQNCREFCSGGPKFLNAFLNALVYEGPTTIGVTALALRQRPSANIVFCCMCLLNCCCVLFILFTNMSASANLELVDGRQRHPRKVLKVRETGTRIDWHKLEWDTATTQLAYGHSYWRLCTSCVVAAICSNLRESMLVPSPPDLQQLALVMFFLPPYGTITSHALVTVTLCN